MLNKPSGLEMISLEELKVALNTIRNPMIVVEIDRGKFHNDLTSSGLEARKYIENKICDDISDRFHVDITDKFSHLRDHITRIEYSEERGVIWIEAQYPNDKPVTSYNILLKRHDSLCELQDWVDSR
ncbi:hypothetical protein GOV11_00020 [Candidatus Woesearchaeota archaeon]|nr:hypothetical protein [Candidatus Woesearchaeota archaeon]